MGAEMKKLCVVLEGRVINVGPWQDKIETVDQETGEVVVIDNPIPDGAVIDEFEITWTADGRIVLCDDYRALRLAEYPSIGDQLDALFKAGVFPAEMSEKIAAVKEKYPKP